MPAPNPVSLIFNSERVHSHRPLLYTNNLSVVDCQYNKTLETQQKRSEDGSGEGSSPTRKRSEALPRPKCHRSLYWIR